MATPDKVWSKALSEEVQREEDASDANVDAFHRSDKSLLFDKAIQGVSLVSLVYVMRSRAPMARSVGIPAMTSTRSSRCTPETPSPQAGRSLTASLSKVRCGDATAKRRVRRT